MADRFYLAVGFEEQKAVLVGQGFAGFHKGGNFALFFGGEFHGFLGAFRLGAVIILRCEIIPTEDGWGECRGSFALSGVNYVDVIGGRPGGKVVWASGGADFVFIKKGEDRDKAGSCFTLKKGAAN